MSWITIALVAAAAAGIAWVVYGSRLRRDEYRYCGRCQEMTQWDKERGCQICDWDTRQSAGTTQSQNCRRPILVMIPFEIDIGFAIGRLICAFYQMALRVAGSLADVHFSFGRVGDKRSPYLPPDFCNLLEFDYRQYSRAHDDRLSEYISRHGIRIIFALDARVNARWLKVARHAGARHVVSY